MAPLNTTILSSVTRISIHNHVFEFSPKEDIPGVPFSFDSVWLGCIHWLGIQKSAFFQLANVCFFLAYTSPNGKYGSLFLHSSIILGYLLYATWAWNVVCAPSIFTWASVFVLLNVGQILNILYQMRTVRFLPDLESLYVNMFKPFKVSRKVFNRITSSEYAHLISLLGGDAYAVENITKTDRLALLMRGRMQVSYEHRPLHCVFAHEFVDSAEFHSSASLRAHNRFTVSITALTECELLIWERADIEYLMIKYPYVRTIMDSLVAKDILQKLIILGNQMSGWRLSQPCDLRLAQKTSFVQSLRSKSMTGSLGGLHEDSTRRHSVHSVEDRSPSPEVEKDDYAPPTLRKSPLSMPYSANIDLAQWYHAFLKRELLCGGQSLSGATRQSR